MRRKVKSHSNTLGVRAYARWGRIDFRVRIGSLVNSPAEARDLRSENVMPAANINGR